MAEFAYHLEKAHEMTSQSPRGEQNALLLIKAPQRAVNFPGALAIEEAEFRAWTCRLVATRARHEIPALPVKQS
jgi:hypothetical protein